jgi:hypothetical protein
MTRPRLDFDQTGIVSSIGSIVVKTASLDNFRLDGLSPGLFHRIMESIRSCF